jgi:hypothetical protein
MTKQIKIQKNYTELRSANVALTWWEGYIPYQATSHREAETECESKLKQDLL